MSAPRALLRLGWRDLRQHRLRSLLVVVLVAVGCAVLAVPFGIAAQVLTPGTSLNLTGWKDDISNELTVDPGTLLSLVLAAALALALGALLITPAFLISARRRVRELGMMAATGVSPAGLSGVVLALAVLTGAIGGVVGAFAGLGFYFALVTPKTPADLHGGVVGAILAAGLGVMFAAGAATGPAVLAARASTVAVLRGVPTSLETRQGGVPDRVPGRREAVLLTGGGLVLVTGGALLTTSGMAAQGACATDMCEIVTEGLVRDGGLLVVGVLFAATGAVGIVAGILAGLARARLRSVVSSYVIRDAARHRARVLPAIAASAMLVAVARVAERLAPDAAVARVVPVRSATRPPSSPDVSISLGGQQLPIRYSALVSASPLVADPALVEALDLGVPAVEAIRAGRVLVADEESLRRGTVTLETSGPPKVDIDVAAELVPELARFADVVLTDAVTTRLGLEVRTSAAIVVGHEAFTEADEARLAAAVAPVWLFVEQGSPVEHDLGTLGGVIGGAAVAVLLVIWVMTALAAHETRTDLGVLDALGIAPRTRRRIAAGQTALIVVPAALLGAPGALVLTLVFLGLQPYHVGLPVQVPVGAVVSLLAGVPLIVLVGAWATGPSLLRRAAPPRS